MTVRITPALGYAHGHIETLLMAYTVSDLMSGGHAASNRYASRYGNS